MNTAERFLISGSCLLLIVFSAVSIVSANGEKVVMKNENCRKTYHITRDASPWLGFTSTYAEEEESKKIKAVSLKNSAYKPISSLKKYLRQDSIIIARDEKQHRVAVESALFSDLMRADATRKTSGRFLIGTYRDVEYKVLKPAELAEFLIESQIVNTFWHVEADICLVLEEDSSVSYIAHYKGKHIYFTDSRNEEPLNFSIIIEKRSGNIFVEAR